MASSNIEIKFVLPKPWFFAEEGMQCELMMKARVGTQLEPADLNRTRSEVLLMKDAGSVLKFSGIDYFNLHHVRIISNLGMPITMPDFAVPLRFDLMNFTRPLEPGHYKLGLHYRPKEEGIPVRTNRIEFDVYPAKIRSIQYRWMMGGRYRRSSLEALWVAEARDGGPDQWFHQVSDKRDPGVVFSAMNLTMPDVANTGPPVIALCPGIAPPVRIAVWPSGHRCGWVRFGGNGRIGNARFTEHGLQPGARLLDPPILNQIGGVSAVFLGLDRATNQPSISVVDVNLQDEAAHHAFPWQGSEMPSEAVVVWRAEQSPACCVYAIEARRRLWMQPLGEKIELIYEDLAEDATLYLLRSDQQVGIGKVLALRDGQDPLGMPSRVTLGWDIQHPELGPVRFDGRELDERDAGLTVVDAQPRDQGNGMELLLLRGAEREPAELVVTPRNGSYLVSYGPNGRHIRVHSGGVSA